MKLQELLQGVAVKSAAAPMDLEIGEVRYDSRAVRPGDLFVAIRGFATDGHQYIAKALAQGAAAVVCEEAGAGVPAVVVADSRVALAEIAANRFGHPADAMTMVGVTGTNGKTTTTYLVKHILEAQGHKVGLIGTNQNLIGSEPIETERTTPESYELHALFARMRDAGCTHVVMEVSSHSLVLHRVHGIHYAVGAFTNLTQDHLDFHKTMEGYRRAKALLFSVCGKGVINLDDPAAGKMIADAKCPVLTFSAESDDASLSAKNIELRADGVDFICAMEGSLARVHLGIPGMFSVHNALTALGTAVALGVPLERAAAALADASGVKGRAEVVPVPADYTVLIDYAHSPDGVENILNAVRGFSKGRVVALFGCGGDRDRTKRPKMGAIAARLADFCIVTSDNPRTEDPDAIIADILAGMQDSKTPREVICDRREAIRWALAHAKKGDTVVLMGKGHETYQEVNHVKHHLDEREEVQKYFAEKAKH
ncbi:UDP-N-acetylmuramoyl-L-alanyl-D-glutamate--2,6-diaminopimelate ligase [Intestinibacillus massiliensis]|nr:UDP-N-acetylmuramoyl-L-alanyl-D-glutamate--2,6-diaminopimelate ligase [Intestinibacillus massiliensis]